MAQAVAQSDPYVSMVKREIVSWLAYPEELQNEMGIHPTKPNPLLTPENENIQNSMWLC